MTEYRDYGYIDNILASNLEVDTIRYSQVYKATHDGEGKRLPLMNRSFISFIYGGRYIEDFNLLATISSNRLDYSLYTAFKDNTTSYSNLDGRQYWGTHYSNVHLEFTLSTDGIDERMLDDFKYWFQAGITRELILSEHPNRAIYARVTEAPRMSLLPFEGNAFVSIGAFDDPHPVKTTLYKGDISLVLESDSPHWYALDNIIGRKVNNTYLNEWRPPYMPDNTPYVSVKDSPDALKIIYEDGIPLGSSIASNMLLGNGTYALINPTSFGRIWTPQWNYDEITWENGLPVTTDDDADEDQKGRAIVVAYDTDTTGGIISDTIIREDENNPGVSNVSKDSAVYFYYSGTAPANTVLSFKMQPKFAANGYINTPANDEVKTGSKPYSTITVQSNTIQELHLTTPNIYTSYNMAIKIIKQYKDFSYSATKTWEDLFRHIREEVRHLEMRAWVAAVLTYFKGDQNSLSSPQPTINNQENNIIKLIQYFFLPGTDINDSYPVEFSFDSEFGKAVGIFYYRTLNKNSIPTTLAGWDTFGVKTGSNLKSVSEDVGDMLRSNYIIIRDRNQPNATGHITNWTESIANGKSFSHRITHNFNTTINNLQIKYKNMYL